MAVTHEHELNFARHLFGRVKDALTGHTVTELLADGPRERFHSGVLLPLAVALPSADPHGGTFTDSDNSTGGGGKAPIDTTSSMSVDFQLCLLPGAERCLLTISPEFTVYFAVFPTHSETLEHQRHGQQDDSEEEDEIAAAADPTADPEDQLTEPDATPLVEVSPVSLPRQIAAEVVVTSPTAASPKIAPVLILPRKFRQYRIVLDPIELTIDPANLYQPLELREQLTDALVAARSSIQVGNPDLWRHLGPPKEARRELKGLSAQPSEGEFSAALANVAKGDFAVPHWSAQLTISGAPALVTGNVKTVGQVFRLNVALVNTTRAFDREERQRMQLEEGALFDCSFSITVDDATIVPFTFHGTPQDYRYDRTFPAIGSNCVANYHDDGERPIISTEAVPLYEQPWYRTRNDLPVNFADLDDTAPAPLDRLNAIASQMDSYLAEWDIFLATSGADELLPEQQAICRLDRDNFAGEVAAYKLGVEVLQRDPDLRRAFLLMNRVFRENGERRAPAIVSWRLFQLAFMVIQLPSLAARKLPSIPTSEYDKALEAALGRVDVLWFPTGGGKTEAYLGLITTALFYDRLRGKQRGVTAWMRFPLRMLSLQQLDRLARVLARAEMIRAAETDLRAIGGDPFAIGYYVGGGNTPNSLRQADLPIGPSATRQMERWQIFRRCPFCESSISVRFDRDQWRLLHVCDNANCYTNIASTLGPLRGSLPVLIVDNEIYRYRPAVLVGTVDKLAVLGFQKHFAHITSSISHRCPVHGYASFGQCVEASNGGPCKQKLKDFERYLQPEKDPIPALLIQDELHLLKEELGTFNAHYEGFLDHLAHKQELRPSKILAATATIEAYETQIFHLYLKKARRFPQPSWRAGESFYATSTPLVHRRLYAGVLTHQRSPESATLRTLEIYHRELQRLRADPSAARAELGFIDLTDVEFCDFLHLYDLSVSYVNRKATGGNIVYNLSQIVSPRLDQPLSARMLTGDNTMTEVGQTIEQIEQQLHDVTETRLDSLIATSLISHGVDLERINFLCMVGMPSKYAEYIQASSRSARNHVGLVIVCFKRGDLRERSQYHYFLPNHRYLDRLVEAVPINRFSAFAAKRTVPGLLVGILLSYYSRHFYKRAEDRSLDNLARLKRLIEAKELTLDMLRADLQAIIGVDHPGLGDLQRRHVEAALNLQLLENWEAIQRSYEPYIRDVLHPMLSFRDVDETLDFIADGPDGSFVERLRTT
jgi:hypothetical protein